MLIAYYLSRKNDNKKSPALKAKNVPENT